MQRSITALFVLSLLGACTTAPMATHLEGDARPHILVVNDDGIDSPGIIALAGAFDDWADVSVVAPDGNRSGAGQSMSLFSGELTVTTRSASDGLAGQAISGTPADATLFAIKTIGQDRPFDLVVSGINRGQNVGDAVNVSGTVGAAREATTTGISAIAVSQAYSHEFDFTTAADYASRFAQMLLSQGSDATRLYNINVPTTPIGVKTVPVGGTAFTVTGFETLSQDGNVTTYKSVFTMGGDSPENSDAGALAAGYITVTQLAVRPDAIRPTRIVLPPLLETLTE